MEIREYTEYREEEILRLYTAVGWTAYTDNPGALEQGFRHSLLTAMEPRSSSSRTSWWIRPTSGRASPRRWSVRCSPGIRMCTR